MLLIPPRSAIVDVIAPPCRDPAQGRDILLISERHTAHPQTEAAEHPAGTDRLLGVHLHCEPLGRSDTDQGRHTAQITLRQRAH